METRTHDARGAHVGMSLSGLDEEQRDAVSVALGLPPGHVADGTVVARAHLLVVRHEAAGHPLLLTADDPSAVHRPTTTALEVLAHELPRSRAGTDAGSRSPSADVPGLLVRPGDEEAADRLLHHAFPAMPLHQRRHVLARTGRTPLALLHLPVAPRRGGRAGAPSPAGRRRGGGGARRAARSGRGHAPGRPPRRPGRAAPRARAGAHPRPPRAETPHRRRAPAPPAAPSPRRRGGALAKAARGPPRRAPRRRPPPPRAPTPGRPGHTPHRRAGAGGPGPPPAAAAHPPRRTGRGRRAPLAGHPPPRRARRRRARRRAPAARAGGPPPDPGRPPARPPARTPRRGAGAPGRGGPPGERSASGSSCHPARSAPTCTGPSQTRHQLAGGAA
ncbi:hypothetical protein SCANM63S_07244 [Streptomyces canarius]